MILRKLVPRTIFGRIFVGIFFVSLLAIAIFSGWFNRRFYDSLNREAEERLHNIARILAENINDSDRKTSEIKGRETFSNLWQFEEKGSWLQNLYWLDVSQAEPRFIASFSAQNLQRVSILPPSAEEIEDLVFANINELEKGRVVMPDPFAAADSRRYKIILYPLLDQWQMLESVIGIEADLEYLRLASSMRRFIIETLVLSLFVSFFIALIIAGNISGKVSFLLQELKRIENEEIPQSADLHLVELNRIHAGLISMAEEISRKDRHLQQVFNRKLEELSFTGAAVAHEIRNPLSAIEMHFGLLKRKLVKLDEHSTELTEISEQLAHLRKLVESFLSYSRLVKPQKEEIRLREFLEQLVHIRRSIWPELNCHLEIDEAELIRFDRTMLQQICENILANAAAAAEKGGVEVKISFKNLDRGWRLSFANNGPKIQQELLERLFTPFATARPGGNGIGLALVQKLVEAHNGEISCENTESGVVFLIEVTDK